MRTAIWCSCLLHAGLLTAVAAGASGSHAPRPPFVANVLDTPAAEPVPSPSPEPVPEVVEPVEIESAELPPLPELPPELPPEPRAAPVDVVPPVAAVPRREAPIDWRWVWRRDRSPMSVPAVPAAVAAPERAHTPTVEPGSNVPPAYPTLARRRGWQGTVLLRVVCDAAGAVVAIEVVRSSGHASLDDAARQAVRAWRFAGGPGAIEVPIEFRLGPT
jgi:protein TonB